METTERAMWDRRYAGAELVWRADPNQAVVAELQAVKPGRALDVGCGEGRDAVWLAERGWKVTAVDFSAVAIEKARALAQIRLVAIRWIVADLGEWPVKPASFDLVLLAYVHVARAERPALHRAMAEAVAPGGTLLVVAHDTTNPSEGTGGPQDPERLFGPEDVVADVAGTGLEVVRAGRLTREVKGAAAPAIDALVRLSRPR